MITPPPGGKGRFASKSEKRVTGKGLSVNNLDISRRISICLQGADRRAYLLYVSLSATQQAGRKTSEMSKLFMDKSLGLVGPP